MNAPMTATRGSRLIATTHDPMCRWDGYPDFDCQCALIARVRADERAALNGKVLADRAGHDRRGVGTGRVYLMTLTDVFKLAAHMNTLTDRAKDQSNRLAHYYVSGVADGGCPQWARKYRATPAVLEEWTDSRARECEFNLTARELCALAERMTGPSPKYLP